MDAYETELINEQQQTSNTQRKAQIKHKEVISTSQRCLYCNLSISTIKYILFTTNIFCSQKLLYPSEHKFIIHNDYQQHCCWNSQFDQGIQRRFMHQGQKLQLESDQLFINFKQNGFL